MGILDDFVAEYDREYDFYSAVARLAQQQIEADLRTSGIRAIVSSRAKRPDRLLEKLQKRDPDKQYQTGADIRNDLPDLAGVRVALYFPGDRDRVNQAITTRFVAIKPPKEFPKDSESKPQPNEYEKRFPGYAATHHRIRLADGSLLEVEKRYASAVVEIQVASVLMHAWAEVEHDLVYKPFQGRLSEDEYAILDELNGLVLAGEISLERLQRAGERRIQERREPFDSQYELAAHLFNHVRSVFQREAGATAMGRVDVLLGLLRHLKLDKPQDLVPYLKELDADFERRPIADQLVERIIAGDEDRHKTYEMIRSSLAGNEPVAHSAVDEAVTREDALRFFIARWSALENMLRALTEKKEGKHRAWGFVASLSSFRGYVAISDEQTFILLNARIFRNEVIHGTRAVDDVFARQAGTAIEVVLKRAVDSEDEDTRSLARAALEKL